MIRTVPLVCFCTATLVAANPQFSARLATSCRFQTSDRNLQRIHDEAEKKLLENLIQSTPSIKVLVESGGYPNAWIGTQPTGGEMQAIRISLSKTSN